MRRAFAASAVFVATLWPLPAGAWTGPTRQRMVDDAIKMCPPALATLLERYRTDLIHGMIDPQSEEAGEEHRQHAPTGYGRAASRIAVHAEQAVTIIGQPGRLRLAVYALGTAAHFTADVNFPLNCAAGGVGDPVFYSDYARYAEKMMPRFPVVLDKQPSKELAKNRIEEFGMASAHRAAGFVHHIRSSYTPAGKRVSAAAFDEKSVPFGVASLSYSQSVNDIARLWTHLWRRAGGDATGQLFAPDGAVKSKKSKKPPKGRTDVPSD